MPSDGFILLVEDNPDDELLTVRALKNSNIANELLVARDGEEALNLLLGSADGSVRPLEQRPSVVLLDLKLPKVDGIEVLKRMRAHDRTRLLPVVILTSSREEEDVLNGYRFGANGYVRKPVDFIEFSEAVKTLGMFWLLLNEPPPSR